MILSERIVVENSILKIANELLQEWGARFKEILIYSDIPFVSRNADEMNYFSEIEVNLWDEKGDFVTFFSVVIFLQNEQVLNICEARPYIQGEIESCYKECIGDFSVQ